LPRSSIVLGNVQDAEAVARAAQRVDAIVNSAALLPNALHLGEQAFHETNVNGSLRVLQQAIAQTVRRLIFFSTISVVDHVTRSITRAQLVPNPKDAYLRSKINAEKSLLQESSSFGGHLAVIRLRLPGSAGGNNARIQTSK
jgi:nucleoside-diphosphate-sugar epimerase